MRAATLALLVTLVLLLVGSIAFAYFGLRQPGAPMPDQFIIALLLGVALTVTVGIGLMALLFYSHRKGYDEPPRLLPPS